MSYRTQAYDTQQGVSRNRDATVPRTARLQTSKQNDTQHKSGRPNANSVTRSPPAVIDPAEVFGGRPRLRPSGIPISTVRSPGLESTAFARNASTSAALGKSTPARISTSQEVPLLMDAGIGSRRRNPEIDDTRTARPLDRSKDIGPPSDNDFSSIFGTGVPKGSAASRQVDLPPGLIPELQALAASSTRHQELYAKSSSSISSPSTQFSNTPSPWSVSTTTTTPTSWSSASPGIVQQVPMKTSGQRSQTVPLPALKREKLPKMPALPETISSISPSQSSGTTSREKESKKSTSKKRTPLNTPAPTPPPRTSSAKQALSRSSSRSDKQRRRHDFEPAAASSDLDRSPLANRGNTGVQTIGDSLQQSQVTLAHNELQQSLGTAPPRPSRQGVLGLEDSRPVIVNTHRSGFTSRHRELLTPGDEVHPPFDFMHKESHPTPQLRPTTPGEPDAQIQSSPGRLGKFSRLGLFGRRGKSPANEIEKSPRKLQRKGPAAGTGHEGYGRYGRRGRKTSQETSSANNSESERSVSSTRRIPFTSSSRKNSRSSSAPNRSSQSDIDEFAVPRLKPVPIIGGSGGSMASNSSSRLEAQRSDPSVHMSNYRNFETPSQSQTSVGHLISEDEFSPATDASLGRENLPSLAVRRSQRFRGETESFNLPTPIRTEALSAPVYLDSHDTSRSSAMAASTSTPSTTTELARGELAQKSREKKPRKLRWNLFRRKEADPGPGKLVQIPSSYPPEELSVSVSTIPVSRSMPYYAMMDSESDVYGNEPVGDFLSQVVQSPIASPFIGGYEPEDEEEPQTHEEIFLPAAPISPLQSFERSPPPVPLQSSVEQIHVKVTEQPQKQPRLARVGRIPPVVSRQERQHKPSRASFSQPFVRSPRLDDADMPSNTSTSNLPDHEHISTDLPPHQVFAAEGQGGAIGAAPIAHSDTEFLRFPSRQASELSSSSTSEGSLSMFGPTLISGSSERQTGRGVYRPESYEPTSPSLDEIWNEYDDFIDHVMSPSQARRSNRLLSAHAGLVSAYAPESSSVVLPSKGRIELANPKPPSHELKRTVFAPALATSATPPVIFPPPTMPEKSVGEDIRLRRSRIVSALHSTMDPSSPFSIRDLINEYESYNRDSTKLSERLSTSTAGRSMERLTPTVSASEVPVEPSHQENVALLDVVERSKNPAAQSELHYASLMVAKWLSFGRVLFSPAHDDIQKQAERHVLVIDGLGNEDWSIYCAVTYEAEKAFIHNLKEKASAKTLKESKASQNAPNNHRRAEVTSFYERFPFPPGFFSAVVLRFPPAMAEAKMKNIIAECRRVLLPGGYLELMLLDLDIVNMGVQTRRAVRELKFRMTTADRQISLRPIIDNVQGVLGARGFSNISRCVVGVPVAGRPNVSGDSSSSSRSSGGSDGLPRRGSGDPRAANASPRMTFGQGRKGTNLSLNDLIADHSDNADAKIGKIVSTTARRWWQHCFEAAVIADGNLSRSIFADKTVLSECKARGSSFKMLIAYAQRPAVDTGSRRRTMSEPAVSTMATIGAHRPSQPMPSGTRNVT